MRRTILASAIVTFTCSVLAQGDQLPERVSMVRLIATPEKFDRREVWVQGFFVCEFENWALYLSGEHLTGENAFWVSATKPIWLRKRDGSTQVGITGKPCEMNRRYVTVLGRVDLSSHGHMGLFAGTLDATRMEEGQ
jgi:hypothetical protein